MLAVENWAKGKNPAIVYFAISLALLARTQCEALRDIKERRVFGHEFKLPDLPAWFAMYRSQRPLLAYNRLISNTSDFTYEQRSLFSDLRKLDKWLKQNQNITIAMPSQQEFENATVMLQNMCSNLFAEIREEIYPITTDNHLKVKFQNALISEELPLSFYYLVWVPSLALFGCSPSLIYNKAINGDIPAIQQLLKLDPLILHNQEIGFQIQTIRLYGKANDYADILNSITAYPTTRYKDMKDARRRIKTDYGAQIFVLAETLKSPLEVPEIRELFDKLAQDFDGTLNDTDITSNEGFDKTIKVKRDHGKSHSKKRKLNKF